jgi:hypothetical protein
LELYWWSMKQIKKDREYPSLSVLCEMYGACQEPNGLSGYYGTFGTKACEEYNQACCDLGDRIHKDLEEYELSRSSELRWITDPREQWMARLVKNWIRQSDMKAVDCSFSENGKAVEVPLNSLVLDYSCRVDRVVTFGSDPLKWVVDYKTSSSLSDQYKMQLAGYAWGWFEKTGEWIDQGVLVRAEKKPKAKRQLEVLPVYELSKWMEPLCELRSLWDFVNRRGYWDERDRQEVRKARGR